MQPGATVLASVTPNPQFRGSGRSEPIMFVTDFGRGRGFCLLFGHDVAAMRNPGFRTLLVRGTEWAARGTVTAAPAADWPETEAVATALAGDTAAAPAAPTVAPEPGR